MRASGRLGGSGDPPIVPGQEEGSSAWEEDVGLAGKLDADTVPGGISTPHLQHRNCAWFRATLLLIVKEGLWKSASVSRSVVSVSLQPHGLKLARLLCPQHFPGKKTGVGRHSLLQGIFPTQGLNPSLLHWQTVLHCLSHQGSPPHLGVGAKCPFWFWYLFFLGYMYFWYWVACCCYCLVIKSMGRKESDMA